MTTNTIIHGSNTEVGEHLHGRKIDLICTDPPFGVDSQMNSAESPEQKAVNQKIDNDGDFDTAIRVFDDMMLAVSPHLAPEVDMYVFTSWHYLGDWQRNLRFYEDDIGLGIKAIGVWDKGYPGKGDLNLPWGMGMEFIFYLRRGRPTKRTKRRNFYLAIDKVPSGENIHPHEKPVAVMEALIEASTKPGDLVFDPFSGSGATSVAAQRCGRDSLAFDTDERWIAPSRARLTQVGLDFG